MSAAPNNQDSIDRALEQLKEHVHPPTVRDSQTLNNDGVRIIRLIFREFEGMGDIDRRLVIHPEGFQTYNGLSYLLGQMGLSIGKDDQQNPKMYGMLTNYLDSPSEACDGFGVWLKARAANIFTWIEVLQPVLHRYELSKMCSIMENIMQFMSDFGIEIPSKATSVYQRFKGL